MGIFQVELFCGLFEFDSVLCGPFALLEPFAEENVVYIDDSIRDKLDEFIKVDFKAHFKDWLYRVIAYFGIRLQNYREEKSLYHLYRIYDLVRHYLDTGEFTYHFSEESKAKAKDLKTNLNIEKHLPRLKEIFSYLLGLYKEEEQ